MTGSSRIASSLRALCACLLIQLAPVAAAAGSASARPPAACVVTAGAWLAAVPEQRHARGARRTLRSTGRARATPAFARWARVVPPPRRVRAARTAIERRYLRLLSIRC